MKNRPQPFRTKILGVLASVLAAGALAPQVPTSTQPAGAREQATLSRVGTTPEKTTANTADTPAPGQALRALLGNGGGFPNRRPGVPPKEWGMSRACKKMRLKNVRAGIQPHYRPRAQA